MKRFLLCMCVLLVLSSTACSKGGTNDTVSPAEKLSTPGQRLLSYKDVALTQNGDKAAISVSGEIYQTFQEVFSEYGACYLMVALLDENLEWYYELELHQFDEESTQSFWYDYITEENGEIIDGEFLSGGYTFPIDNEALRPDKLYVVVVNIAVYDRGFIFDENFALWYQDGELKLEEGMGIPEFAELPETPVTGEPENTQKPSDLTFYSVDDEETWFVIEGEPAKEFITKISNGEEAELGIYFIKMIDEYNSETVAYLPIYGRNVVEYSANISHPAVDGYGMQTDGRYFKVSINKEKNNITIYLNTRKYVQSKLEKESTDDNYKAQLSKLENNASLFTGAEKCLLENGIYTDEGPDMWDMSEISKNERYSAPIQYQVIMAQAYEAGYVSYAEDLNYFKPVSDDYTVIYWNDDLSQTTMLCFDTDGRIISAKMRCYAPGQVEWYSDRDDAKTIFRDANVMYIEYDVKNLEHTSLHEYSKGRKQSLYMSKKDDLSTTSRRMYFSMPDFTKEDLTLKSIKLIENLKEHLYDAEILTDDYIVMKDTYSPNDGTVQYSETLRTIVDFYDETSHIRMGYVKIYTFDTDAIAKQFHTNIANPNASVIGNLVYIKGTYGYNDQTQWSGDTKNLLWNMGDPNQPKEVLWSRNYQTEEEFLEDPLYDEDLINNYMTFN